MTRTTPRRPHWRTLLATFAFLAGFGLAVFAVGSAWMLLVHGGRATAAEQINQKLQQIPPAPLSRLNPNTLLVANSASAVVNPVPTSIAPGTISTSSTSNATASPAASAPASEPLTDLLRRRLEDAYHFKADVAVEHRPAQLVLLPDRQPVTLKATVERPDTLPASFREVSNRVHWVTDTGKITQDEGEPAKAPASAPAQPATLTLPEGSRMVNLRAVLDVDLVRSPVRELPNARSDGLHPDSVRPDEVKIHKEESLRLLTPVSSALMKDGVIDGFNIGHYLPKPRPLAPGEHAKSSWPHRYPERYQVPAFFYKVTPEIKDLTVAPDQPLGMYMIDFPWKSLGKTQYIALDYHLVLKLDDLLNLMRQDGHKITRFVPIYGFRPPSFNLTTMDEHPGTNLKTAYSMHQYGRAIDMIVDEDGDNVIDDLNHDGTIDMRDPDVIMKYVTILDKKYAEEKRMEMVGGAGLYWRNDFVERAKMLGKQTPYIHIDTRGFLGDGGPIRWYEPDDKPAPKKSPAKPAARVAAANSTHPQTTPHATPANISKSPASTIPPTVPRLDQ